ncbi:MAG TPA: class I SAM-dependent methyltransferase [Nocardioides sp.]|uniref:class I SAM-dependent methyltransferase n=1 Tax=Nocardioides sp. TaxID=35761 RepID=UPI002F3F7023
MDSTGCTPEPTVGDAFGAMLLDYLTYAPDYVPCGVIERDDGSVSVEPSAKYFQDEDEWDSIYHDVVPWLVGVVIDLGCGAGRHALPLQRRGHRVIGIDSSPGAVKVSRSRGLLEVHEASVQDAVLGEIIPHGVLTYLLLGNGLGLLSDKDSAGKTLHRLAELAPPGSHLVGESLLTEAAEREAYDAAYADANERAGRWRGEQRARFRYGPLATRWFSFLFLPPEGLDAIATDSGWTMQTVTKTGPRYLAVLVRN